MVTKFTGTGFNANALLLDFLRDEQGNPLKTPNSFLVLHNPVRQKINDIIDWISEISFLTLNAKNKMPYYLDNPIGIAFATTIDGGDLTSDDYSDGNVFIMIDGGAITDDYNNAYIVNGGKI